MSLFRVLADFESELEGVNAACCGIDGLCGYSPTQCGSGNWYVQICAYFTFFFGGGGAAELLVG
jgi:hypothetical protein